MLVTTYRPLRLWYYFFVVIYIVDRYSPMFWRAVHCSIHCMHLCWSVLGSILFFGMSMPNKCRSKIPSSSKVLLNFCWLNKINFDGVFGTNFDRESSEKTHFSAFGGTSSGPPGGGSLGLAQRGNSPVDISIFIFISGASIYDIYCIFQYYRDTILVFICANKRLSGTASTLLLNKVILLPLPMGIVHA